MRLSYNELEELFNIYVNGPVFDGDLIGKSTRDALMKHGLTAKNSHGDNICTDDGRFLCKSLVEDKCKTVGGKDFQFFRQLVVFD